MRDPEGNEFDISWRCAGADFLRKHGAADGRFITSRASTPSSSASAATACSPDERFITGEALAVNGGAFMD